MKHKIDDAKSVRHVQRSVDGRNQVLTRTWKRHIADCRDSSGGCSTRPRPKIVHPPKAALGDLGRREMHVSIDSAGKDKLAGSVNLMYGRTEVSNVNNFSAVNPHIRLEAGARRNDGATANG
jgi:hypothetical protein